MGKSFKQQITHRLLPNLYAFGIKWCLKLLLKTCRIQIEGIANLVKTAEADSCLLMLWHNRLAGVAEVLERGAPHFNYLAFVSKSRDGEIVAAFVKSYTSKASIRVSHLQRGMALKGLIDQLEREKCIVIVTPDGPKGPSQVVKPGILFAANQARKPIVPYSWTADRVFRLSTWDKLMLPMPFSTLTARFGPPIEPWKQPLLNEEDLTKILSELI